MNMEKTFFTSLRPHVLMITNHGIHEWEIIPGLPDTGGQNVFVNQFTATLTQEGFKITIVNRGGYPNPITGEMRTGVHYKDENQRILYLDDGLIDFVRKEDMDDRIPYLAQILQNHLISEELGVDLIISHYWDGAKLGMLFNRSLSDRVKHLWVPHSLGAVKKRNMDSSRWKDLRINERIANEKEIMAEIDGIAATSDIIRQSLKKDYNYQPNSLFLPPCVDSDRFQPHKIPDKHPVWLFLSQHARITPEEIRERQIVTEISRTDTTKRKDILIRAFAQVNKRYPETLLVISIDQTNAILANELTDLIRSLGIEKDVIVLGSVWKELPDIYAVTDIYCTASVMEGFGMSAQEAAATKVPIVSSNFVPFATEYLLGDGVKKVPYQNGTHVLRVGQGAIVVSADDVNGFATALELLLTDEVLRHKMGINAYKITIPYFTWKNIVKTFLEDSDVKKVIKVPD